MKKKTFNFVFALIFSLCVIATVAHAVYAVYAYEHCSIIEFIAGELW